jgi:hypothetical protein
VGHPAIADHLDGDRRRRVSPGALASMFVATVAHRRIVRALAAVVVVVFVVAASDDDRSGSPQLST